ncbi:helix-turn-helix domain-containing protein [Streptomyces sp. NPDC002159]
MSKDEPVQAPRTAWMNALRDEALRISRVDVSKVVHIGWVIASFTNSDGTNAFPSSATIAAIAGCSEETVTRARKVLKALDVLEEQRRPNASSVYSLKHPVGDGRLDWDAHMDLYTDTRQARRKKEIKQKEVADYLAGQAGEGRTPTQNGFRTPTRNGNQTPRNPFPDGVPEPVPAGGSGTPGNRSGTGRDTDAERVPEPVPAGGVQRDSLLRREDKGPDKDPAEVEPQPLNARASAEPEQGPALHSVPTPPGRARTAAPSAASQPPLLMAVQGPMQLTREEKADLRAAATPDHVRAAIAAYGRSHAVAMYGHALVLPHIAHPPTPGSSTGT